MKCFFNFLILLLCPFVALGGENRPSPSFKDVFVVKNITMDDGLTHNFIDDLYRDSSGYIWVSSSGSLARFDGYEFVNFTTNSTRHHIKSNFVKKVAEDNFKRLWVASDGGLDLIDLADLNVMTPEDLTGLYNEISHAPAGFISTDSEGNLWIHSGTEIYCLKFDKDGKIEHLARLPHGLNPNLKSIPVKTLECAEKGVVAEISGQICNLSYDGNKILVKPLMGNFKFREDIYVSDFLFFDNNLWIATDNGIYSYDMISGKIKEFRHTEGETGLSQNFITSLNLLPDNTLVAGSLNGLNIWDWEKQNFVKARAVEIDPRLQVFNHDFINCLLVDDGMLWAGTEGAGIDIFSPRNLFSKLIRHNNNLPNSLSDHPVNAIFEDNDGTLWIGTVEGGLNRCNSLSSNNFSHFTKENGALSHNSVSAITADRNGILWIGTWGGGLNALEKLNPKNRKFTLNSTSDGKYRLDYIAALCYDPYNNYIWVAANNGLYIYDINQNVMRVPFPDALKVTATAGAALSSDGILWLGGESGLFSINLKETFPKDNFTLNHLPYKLDNPSESSREKITCLAFSHDGTLWIGSNGNGIYKRIIKDGKEEFLNFSSFHGLPNDIAHGIAEDIQGNLWIATYHGLSCMTPDSRFINFGKHNGLDTEQFYWNAAYRMSDGELLFGSVDGLLTLKGFPEGIKNYSQKVKFTSFKSDSDLFYGDLQSVTMKGEEKNFEIGFSSLDYLGAKGGKFFYMMEGFDKEWKELPINRHSVSFTNLPHGNYSLKVKYVGSGQSFAEAPVSVLNLVIPPQFYQQTWFIVLAILLLILCIAGAYLWRIRNLTIQRNRMQSAINNGIKEISDQKSLIEAHAAELLRQNEELKQRNLQISEQKAQLSEMAQKLQRMTVDRISFFTNITHEFRTPITLIIGPIERALKLSSNPKVIEQLNFVERNSKYLLSLVNQLMDFRKVESGRMDIVRTDGNFRRFLEDIILPFRAYGDERNIRIETLYHLSATEFEFDHDALRKVIINLLGNAIKFTPDNGHIKVFAALSAPGKCNEDPVLYLCVSDNGCGINEKDLDQIFERFYQGQSQMKYPLIGSSDSGIGLYLCRKIIEVYGGKITARNNHGEGCSFRVLVPVPASSLRYTDYESLYETPQQNNYIESDSLSHRFTILIVEDNKDMRGYIKSFLSEQYDILEASNGREALKILLSQKVDFIISDLMMPVMDGLELSRQVKENFTISHIPFIMLTAKTDSETHLEGFQNGVDDYIFKPFDEEMLKARIKNILENKQRYQQHFMNDMETEKLNIQGESRDKKFIDKVMEVVKENYQNSYFDVGDFAQALGVSRSLLNKKLQSLVGQSANQLMRSYRMKISRELIIQNRVTKELNISEIAFKVGFNDSKYFTRCFTKLYGISPTGMLKGDLIGAE